MPTIIEFAQSIKTKYPQYQHIDDKELASKMLEKYPEYKDRVFDTDPKTQQQITGEQPTEGMWDAIKKGGQNIVSGIKESGKQLDETLSSNVNPFIKTAKTATTLIKGVINPMTEVAIATPLRVAGEAVQGTTGVDINEFTSQGVQRLVQKGMDTQTAQKAMAGWNRLKEADPESAMALSTVMDIADIASNAIGLKGAGVAEAALAKAGGKALKAGEKAASKTVKAVEKTGEYVTGQAYGLKPETVKSVIKNPELFTSKEMAKIDRESIFTKTKSAIDKRLEGLSETGKEYDAIKKSQQTANISEKTITDLLESKGIKVENGKLNVDLGSDIQLSSVDAKGLEDVLDLIKGKENLTAKEVLNLRTRLSNLSKFGEGKTDASKLVAKEIRKAVDAVAKKDIAGLAELDAKFAPERQLLSKIKRTIFNNDGTIKDNAISKIATLTGKGKEMALERMEKIVPGIREDLNILKAIEDIEYAKGQKVGAYMRTGLGVGTGAMAGGPVGAIIGAIVTSPQVGISLLRSYGKLKNISSKVIDGITGKMKKGIRLAGEEKRIMDEAVDNASKKVLERAKNARPGMTIQDVSGKVVSGQDKAEIMNTIKKIGYQGSETSFIDAFNEISPKLRSKLGDEGLKKLYSKAAELLWNNVTSR